MLAAERAEGRGSRGARGASDPLWRAPAEVKRWARGTPSAFDPAKHLQSLLSANLPMPSNLPVNVFTAYLCEKAPHFSNEEIRSIANLYQTVLEVERDA